MNPPIEPPDARPLPELTRLARSLAGLPRLSRRRRALPRGSGPVMVIPGFMTSDRSTVVVRRLLTRLGYDAIGWDQGVNRGNLRKLVPEMVKRARKHARGERIMLVGWSLGGVIAREVARENPGLVGRIVTMGTPVIGGPKYTSAGGRYARQGYDVDAIAAEVAERNKQPIDAPITAIYSRADQIVSWRACLDPNPQNRVDYVEVQTGHIGMGFDPVTLTTVAEVLSLGP